VISVVGFGACVNATAANGMSMLTGFVVLLLVILIFFAMASSAPAGVNVEAAAWKLVANGVPRWTA